MTKRSCYGLLKSAFSIMEFTPPGPGVWELEQTHFSRPATRYASSIFPRAISKGFGEGTRRYGLLLDTLDLRVVNDFVYSKFCPVGAPEGAKGPPPKFVFKVMTWLHPEIRRRIKTGSRVLEQKLWREDLRRWDERLKPDSVARNSRLQKTAIASLPHSEFIKHLEEVRDNSAEMIYRHHIFSIPCSMPVGHFLVECQGWTGLPSGQILGVLKGAAPVSRGIAAKELEAVQVALRSAGIQANSPTAEVSCRTRRLSRVNMAFPLSWVRAMRRRRSVMAPECESTATPAAWSYSRETCRADRSERRRTIRRQGR